MVSRNLGFNVHKKTKNIKKKKTWKRTRCGNTVENTESEELLQETH